jgi:hypothetical protein
MKRWKATHRITTDGRTYLVMIVPSSDDTNIHCGFTRREWDTTFQASFIRDRDRWFHKGKQFFGSIAHVSVPDPRLRDKGIPIPATWARLPEFREAARKLKDTPVGLAVKILNHWLSRAKDYGTDAYGPDGDW